MSSPTSGPGFPARPALQRWLGPWVAEVNAATLRSDALAAVLAAVLVLPQGIAFAALAGLPPAWGLYAAVVPTAVAALAGSSRQVLTGPTNALSLALGAALAPLAVAGSAEYLRLALVLTLMVGALQLAVALLRLGVLTHFISPSVMLGFTTGAAALIAGHAGLSLVQAPAGAAPALAVGAGTLAVAVLLRWRWPRAPGLLLALLVGTALAVALGQAGPLGARHLGLPWTDAQAWQTARIGTLPQPWPAWAPPALAWADVPRLATIALALTLVALGQSIAIAKALAARTGQALDVNRECLGQGLGNLAGGCFSAFVSCGSLNRSVPHLEAGARTPLAAVMAAGLVLLLVAGAAPLLAVVPMAAIDALLLLVAWTLVDTAQWRELWRLDKREAAVAGGTLAATLLLPLQVAVLAGVAASLVVYLHRTAHPALRSMGFAGPPQPGHDRRFVVLPPAAPECPQLKLLRMEGPVWFGAEAHVADALRALREQPEPPAHLLVMSKSMNFIDPAGATLWERERGLRSGPGQGLYFHRPRPEVLATWRDSGFLQRLGEDHVFPDKRSAIAAIVPRLDPAVCARCTARVFEECAGQPGPPPAG
ncbi:sulfate transporter [beta proteobacterium AAP121]|nr:sulfate transporter [beta proteobacterium AAP65]KPF94137.1 sulfate transporter [beta proteobacterium AAP121]